MSLASNVSALATRIATEFKSVRTALAGKAASVHTHVPSTDLVATGTKDATTFLRGDDTWATVSATGDVVVPTQPDEPVGFSDGELWYDTDDDTTTSVNQSDVVNLVTDLAAKVAKSGDTMTGPLALPSAEITPSTGTAKGRFGGLAGVEAWTGMFLNCKYVAGSGWLLDDATKPGWFFKLDSRAIATEFAVYRIPAGAGYHTDEAFMFRVDSTGLVSVVNRITGLANATGATDALPRGQADGRYAALSHTHVATTDLTATGTKDATTYLRGDNTWAPVQAGGAQPLADADKGVFSPYVTYAKGDVVSYNGRSYVAKAAVAQQYDQYTAPTYVSRSASAVSNGSVSLAVGSAVQAGDLMVIAASQYANSAASSIGGGAGTAWTTVRVTTDQASGSYNAFGAIYTRVATAADVNATLTVSVNTYGGAALWIYRNASLDSSRINHTPRANATAGTPILTGTTTPSSAGRVIHFWSGMSGSSSQPTGFTIDAALGNTASQGAPQYYMVGTGDEAYSSGSTTARSMTVASNYSTAGVNTYVIPISGVTVRPTMNAAEWTALPFQPAYVQVPPTWELIEKKQLTAVASQTVGNLRFDNIPTKYTRLKITSSNLRVSTNSSGNLQMIFNNDTGANYGCVFWYASGAGESGSNTSNVAYALAIYNYFYGGPSATGMLRNTDLSMEISTPRSASCQYRAESNTLVGERSAPYTSRVRGTWAAPDAIYRIDLYTPFTSTWDSGSTVYLYGMVE
jgi:hypothetical protein